MPYDLALFDLISPYLLRGDTFGQWHAALSVIYVFEHSVTMDDGGVVIRGIGKFSGDVSPYFDPTTMTFGVNAENTEGHPAFDPGRRDPWIDVRDAQIDFELSAPRVASQKVSAAVAAIGGASGFAGAAAVLAAYDPNVADAPPSDYASTEFTLDLLLTTVVLRPPFLHGAKLDPSGILVKDDTNDQVKITLPKIKIRLSQGSNASDPLTATILSFGSSGLDAQDDLGVAQLITMDPPYAFIGSSSVVGIGFRTGTLDLSDGFTPPDVLSQFGFDDSWTGVYLPELRLYIAPHGAKDLAFDASATNLLIGIGASSGITGDFELAIVDQGSGPVKVGARFYDATGRCYGITRTSDQTATVTIPDHTRMVIDVDGGLTPYTASAAIGSAAEQPGRLFQVDFGPETSLTIVIKAKGSQPGATDTNLTITAALRAPSAPPPAGSTDTPDNPVATVQTTSITQGTSAVTVPRLKLVSQTSSQATIALDTDPTSAAQTHWTIDGTDRGTSATVTVDCAQGASVQVEAQLPGASAVAGAFTAYYRFDHPKPNQDDPSAWVLVPDNTRTAPAVDDGTNAPWSGGSAAATALKPILDAVLPGTEITIKGYASYETGDDTSTGSNAWKYNNQLAGNRATGLEALIADYSKNNNRTFQIVSTASDMSSWPSQGDPGRNLWWKAVASWSGQNTPGTTTTGTVSRSTAKPSSPAPVPDNPQNANPPPPPSWFKKIDAKVRIVRDHFVACEVSGKFDIQTSSEEQLAKGGVPNAQIPKWGDVGSQNPADGIIDVRVVVQIDDATDVVTVSGYFGADPADRDGLKMIGWLPPAPDPLPSPGYGTDFLGLGVAFWPLIADAAGAVANDGAEVELAVTAGGYAVVAGMAALPWFRVERIVWYGGEIDVQARPDGFQALLLVDVETAISADISIAGVEIITIPRKTPLVVRYKAIGFILGNAPGEAKFPFRPYFDSSKGYTIDASKPGTIQVHEPFDQILKILGARLSRNNPFLLEADLGFAIDLGVVSIDRARVRLNLSPGGPPELTAFGASVDIPGALKGKGYAEVGTDAQGNTVIKGAMDLTITPVNVRVAATLAVAQISAANGGPATGIQVSLEVDFPVAIPLADSGLGIYGFVGLFAMNFARDETIVHDATTAPALAWLKATNGDVANPQYWTPKINSWAFGVGALLGTEGSDIIFNLKGMVLLELPGPRLMLLMKANLLAQMPDLPGPAEGTFLAVIDLDFGRGTLTIGLSIDYKVDPLIEIKIPVEAFFDFNDTSDWHLYLGQYANQVQATVLQVFDASGYLMLSGNGIPAHNNLPAVTGFSIATGLHVSFKWGTGPLYAQLTAGFDAVVGFSPFRMAGILSVRGTLHLFIIDISAWAELDVDVGDDGQGGKVAQISGQICGQVDFLFFSISGCVDFTLSANLVPIPDPPPLIKSLKLISRSPALVVGTGVDKPIDAGLADAVEGDQGQPGGDLPSVPIDVIPALMMAIPPLQDAALSFLGQAIGGTPDAPSDGWVQRGDVWYQYTVTKLELIGPVTAGKTPATWWNTKAGDQALEAQLALLSWVPDPTPKAVGSSKYLDETTDEKWGTVCEPAAPGAPVFWTFFFQILGPSDWGWAPLGLPYPDPPGTIRSAPPDVSLKVTERWRCGIPPVDHMRGIVPAEIEGAAVQCPVQTKPPALGATVIPADALRLAGALSHAAPGVLAAQPRAAVAAAGSQPPVVDNPISAIRGGLGQAILPDERLTLDQIVQRFAAGQPVSRATLSQAILAAGEGAPATSKPGCFGWALASPIFDDGAVIEFGSQDLRKAVEEAWAERKFKPGPLDDAVVFEMGEFEYARFYMWVPRRFIELKVIVVAASDVNDSLSNEHVVSGSDIVPPVTLPGRWTNPSSPWEPAVFVLEELAGLAAKDYVPVFVEIKGAPGADRVQIGCPPASRPLRRQLALRPFYVGAIEALKVSEGARWSYDTTEQQKKQGVLQDALGLDSADWAFLEPAQTYQVRVTYDAKREKRTQGQPPSDQKSVGGQSQLFWFKTDNNPPDKLDPWVLVALPGEAEQHYFASETVRVVFATNNVGTLYGAYGKKLQARLRPSSYVAPPSTPAVPHPFPLSPANLQPVKAAILSPWENSVQNLVSSSLPCISISGERIRHSMVEIPIPLDLYTDYLLDIEMLDAGAEDGSPGQRVWRGSFSTGGFRTAQEFADSCQTTKVNHRGVHPDDVGKLQAIGVTFASRDPEGSELDAALTQAGLDALPVPKKPGVTIFWDPDSPDPQPVAILLDASEPMWRSRPIPTLVTDPPPSSAQRYELLAQPWLDLVQQPGGDAIVDHIVPAPGGQRALVTLKPGSRGKHVMLALRRIAHTEAYLDGPSATDQFYAVLDMTLNAAPWEEVD